MQGNVPMHPGQGPGLSLHDLGETGGSQTVTLLASEIPSHSHSLSVSQGDGSDTGPSNEQFAGGIGIAPYAAPGQLAPMSPNSIAPAGGGQPHNNMMPYLTLNFCIALQGVYPPRG
jgi:microcystin-dependent protein